MSDRNESSHHQPSDEERMMDEQALDWLIRRDFGFTPEDQDAFFQWLAEDARHGEWLARHQRTYKQFDSLVQWCPEHSEEPNPDLLANAWFQKSWVTWLSAFGAAAVILLGFFIWQSRKPDESFHGYLPEEGAMARVYQIHRLRDGSIVELNKGAQIAIRFSGAERRVDLLSGEVYFEVARNPSRPFIVSARGIDVKAVGTAFNMRLGEDSLEVVVTHGKVLMDSSALVANGDLKDAIDPAKIKPELGAGQRSIISFVSEAVLPHVEAISEEEIDEKLTWKHQVLEFIDRPLSEIVEEFNRYNTRQIIILDEELLNTQITATFRSYNMDGFVRLLELTSPVRVSGHTDKSITLARIRELE